MVLFDYLPKKSLLVVVSGWQTKFNVSQDRDLEPGPEPDNTVHGLDSSPKSPENFKVHKANFKFLVFSNASLVT